MRLRSWVTVLIIGLFAVSACSEPENPSSNLTPADAGNQNQNNDDLDVEDDTDGDDGDDGDGGDDDTDAEDDADADEPPEERSCPGDVEDSCAAEILGCPGDLSAQVACVSYGEEGEPEYRLEAQFSNDAVVQYRTVEIDGEPREFRTAYNAGGERCYNLSADEAGSDPQSWTLGDPQFGSFALDFVGDNIHIDCTAGQDNEVCSRTRIEAAYSLPLERPTDCEPFSPDDNCSFDSECGDGEGCCVAEGTTFRQCLDLEYCLSQRFPIECETNADCEAGSTCSRCTRDNGAEPERECVPDEIIEAEFNSLGCVADGCTPGGDSCDGGDTCCRSAGLYQCLPPFECDDGPDPNPVCDPESSQPCPSASQDCCFSDAGNEFRCLLDPPVCDTNVCFSDTDCPSGQECCGNDPDNNTAGSCVDSCEPPDTSCNTSDDCIGEQYCCVLPGLNEGVCEASELSCDPPLCESDDDCVQGWICCDEAPLTEGVCFNEPDGCPQ